MQAYALDERGYHLLHNGMQALADVEANGMYVRTEYLEKAMKTARSKISELKASLTSHSYWRKWKKRYGFKAKITSEEQLAWLFYTELKKPILSRTDKGKPSTDNTAVTAFKDPFADNWILLNKWTKISTTYLRNIKKESRNSLLHPFFNLHITDTFRSSSDSPNFQNFPVRDPMMGKIIRETLGFRPGNIGIEIDYSGVEVTGAACYHKDPNMISYLVDDSKDMHRDMAAQCFMLDPSEVVKQHRYCGKNQCVFPWFYGDFYLNTAKSLWNSIASMDLKGPDGKESLYDHLASQGIEELGVPEDGERPRPGTFCYHIQQVEKDFWGNRFAVYGEWKKRWYNSYLEKGYFDTLTGFRLSGIMSRNQVINYPVQGSCFHCLLWSLIEINKELKKRKMKAKLVGQIHDSIVADVPIEEVELFVKIARYIMTKKINKWAPWLIVPLKIEMEFIAEGLSWYDKKEVNYDKGVWSFYDKANQKNFRTKDITKLNRKLQKAA